LFVMTPMCPEVLGDIRHPAMVWYARAKTEVM
jgi:hypothetical protein